MLMAVLREPHLPGARLAAIAVAFFVAGTVKGITGLGLPLVSLAILVFVVDFKVAVALMTVPLFVTNIWQALSGPHLRTAIRRHAAFLIIGFAGTLTIQLLSQSWNERWLVALLGLITMIYTGMALLTRPIRITRNAEPYAGPAIAMVSGFFSGISGAFSLPAALYFQALGLGKDVMVQTLGVWFLTASIALALGVSQSPVASPAIWLLSVVVTLPAMAGMVAGQRIRKLLSEERFRTSLLAALCIVGAWLTIKGLFLTD